MMEFSYTAVSVNGIPIRLLAERWSHTNACCDDVLGTIERPDFILRGWQDTQVAIRRMVGGRYLMVRYCESGSREGFVISARIGTRIEERGVIWRPRAVGPG